ncbi:MAG: transcriptional regulator [Candidatus Bathyarchaeota archaeon]
MTPNRLKPNGLHEILIKINENLEQINVKLGKLIGSKEATEQADEERRKGLEALDVMTLLSLPDHLRKTAMILSKLGRATANRVSMESGRKRAVESSYLNQLVVMGHVKKTREGHDVYFYVE